jgi:c-di-GMP-binding flagellar brake protein YcgR
MSKPPSPEHTEQVHRPARIRQLLGRVRGNGSELQVQLQGAEQSWRTTISRIDQELGVILYGQLTPATWHTQPGMNSPARIYCREKQNCISYSALLEPATGDDGLNYLQSPIPEKLLHHQLRQQYRVSPMGRHNDVKLVLESGEELSGELLNISAGGFRCLMNASPQGLGDPRQLLQCHTKIAGLLELEFQGRICNSVEAPGGVALSLAVVELPAGQRQQLSRCLVQLERDNMHSKLSASRG